MSHVTIGASVSSIRLNFNFSSVISMINETASTTPAIIALRWRHIHMRHDVFLFIFFFWLIIKSSTATVQYYTDTHSHRTNRDKQTNRNGQIEEREREQMIGTIERECAVIEISQHVRELCGDFGVVAARCCCVIVSFTYSSRHGMFCFFLLSLSSSPSTSATVDCFSFGFSFTHTHTHTMRLNLKPIPVAYA